MTPSPPNDDLFAEAIFHLRQQECHWEQQLEYALGHPADLAMDYDALHERYELVRPFIHRILTGTLGALSKVGFDPALRAQLSARVNCVIVTVSAPGQGYSVGFADQLVLFQGPLTEGPEDPAAAFEAELRRALNQAESASPPMADLYERAGRELARLDKVLREVGLWPGEKPPGPLEVRGAFGCENMTFAQWLAWVLMPRLREIIDQRGDFPANSQLAVYAARELNGLPGEGDVHAVLAAIDELASRFNSEI